MNNQPSIASQLAKKRWDKATPDAKRAHIEKMNTARLKKMQAKKTTG